MKTHWTGLVALGLLAGWGMGMAPASAQEIKRTSAEAAPLAAAPDGPLTLEECIALGMQHQPSLDAARASLAAAGDGQRALDKLIIPRLFRKDLPIRREQACLGVTIASAALSQAEVDTRYAITRNFFTVQYVHMQQVVIGDTLSELEKSRARADKLFRSGDPKIKITKLDIDGLDVQIAIVRTKKAQADNGLQKAIAALREAMGLACDEPIKLAAEGLPKAVYPYKVFVEEVNDKNQKVKKEVTKYHRLYQLDKKELIAAAIANRGEIVQADSMAQVLDLEVCAQSKRRGWTEDTFAMGADLHATPVPLMRANTEYSPGAIAPEMPPKLAGRQKDRMARAADLAARGAAVVDKTHSLVALDVEAQYFKWLEAAEDIEDLTQIEPLATGLPKRVRDLDPLDFTARAVIDASTTAVTVRAQLNEARHMHALALAGLERATGGAFHVFPVPTPPAK